MPNRSSAWPALLGLVIAGALAVYTTHSLNKMARIRGFTGSVPIEQQVVTRKTQQRVRIPAVCFLWWRGDPPARVEHRVQADCSTWEQIQIGDPLEIVRLGDDDDDVYLRQGEIYASDGNFAFDSGLLAIELAVAGYCLFRLVRRAKRT